MKIKIIILIVLFLKFSYNGKGQNLNSEILRPNSLENIKKTRSIILNQYDTLDNYLKYFNELLSVDQFSISRINLSVFPDKLCLLKNLKYLSINYCKLEFIPGCINNFDSLEVLNLHHNNISIIPKQLFENNKLRVLNLSYNDLQDIPIEIKALNDLEVLDLSGNKIENWSFLTYNPSILELHLGRQNLKTLPIEMIGLKNLKILYLDFNKNINQNKVFKQLLHSNSKIIEFISLESCGLNKLDINQLIKFENLKTLDLSNNKFSKKYKKKIKSQLINCNVIFDNEIIQSLPKYP